MRQYDTIHGQTPKPAAPAVFRNAALGSHHDATPKQFPSAAVGQHHDAVPGQHPGAAAEQYPGAASSQPRPAPDPPRSASGPQHPSAVSGPSQEPRNKKSVRIATFLRLAIVANSPIANRGTKTQQKWHISRLKEPRRAPNRKKVAKIPSFLFLQWVRSLQSGSSHENARSIMTSNPKSETSKAPAMRTPPEKPIWLESTLP